MPIERKQQAGPLSGPFQCSVTSLPPPSCPPHYSDSLLAFTSPSRAHLESWNVGMFYYCEAVSEQRAARCIVATGVLLERGLRRDVESLHPRACMEVPSSCASCKICCQGQITQRRMPDLGQKDANVIRYEDQEVRRSNIELGYVGINK
jgi:hypothetical protein